MRTGTNTGRNCRHFPRPVAGLEVVACPECREVLWFRNGEWLDPAEGMTRLFGQFELVAKLKAVAAPAPDVLTYAPDKLRARSRLAAFPPGIWLEAAPALWLSHDNENLLLAPLSGLHLENLARDL